MQKKSSRPLVKHTINLFQGQLDTLQELHPRLRGGLVIRTLVDDHIRAVKEGAAKSFEPVPETAVKLEEIL